MKGSLIKHSESSLRPSPIASSNVTSVTLDIQGKSQEQSQCAAKDEIHSVTEIAQTLQCSSCSATFSTLGLQNGEKARHKLEAPSKLPFFAFAFPSGPR
ncbi:hypothetical protein CEXT_186021 [Caerostris extrusa]|uniref:Uncharacterized protein n=1 Tax=Caerostris extrusa TaxID=172846 RepID=A0AAV4MHP0_CAEEX|nr:hypothetical protein CEXT_186021 [Caerostris extrusa]